MLKTEEGRRKILLTCSVISLVFFMLFYIVEVLNPIVWGVLLCIGGLMTLFVYKRWKVFRLEAVFRIICATVCMVALTWGLYESFLVGFDGASIASAWSTITALVFAITVFTLPSAALTVYLNPEDPKGYKKLFRETTFLGIVGIYLHGVEPFCFDVVLRLTSNANIWIHGAVCILAAAFSVFIAVLGFLILLDAPQKKQAA